MARPINEENRKLREEQILEAARQVFVAKGYIDVTMKDLVEAAGMSRGGFYFYYSSVADVFRASMARRARSRFEDVRRLIEVNIPFDALIETYFATQKQRLLHMEESMLRALYEYLFTHRGEEDNAFRTAQMSNILETARTILQLGVRQGVMREDAVEPLAEHLMFAIEGLNVLALLGGCDAGTIDRQFALLKTILEGGRSHVL